MLVSGGSCLYAIVRARHLSMAEASDAPLAAFLMRQSDMILLLCGGPVVWYVSQRRQHASALGSGQVVRGGAARAIHHLRQVFAALLLGTEMLERKSNAEPQTIAALSQRLNLVVREGIGDLALLGEPYPPDLLD